jgi:hypothetical protein
MPEWNASLRVYLDVAKAAVENAVSLVLGIQPAPGPAVSVLGGHQRRPALFSNDVRA